MSRFIFKALFLFSLAGFSHASLATVEELINYLHLNHTIDVAELRAGNHDPEGQNEYYFTVHMHGLVLSKEEAKKEIKDRKKHSVIIGSFGDFKVKSLNFWNKSEDPIEGAEILGEQIRALVSNTMRQFKVLEAQVSVYVVVEMFERNMQFGVLGEDVKVGETSYFAIPESLPRRPNLKDLKLEIVDDKGSLVVISVVYKKNGKGARKN